MQLHAAPVEQSPWHKLHMCGERTQPPAAEVTLVHAAGGRLAGAAAAQPPSSACKLHLRPKVLSLTCSKRHSVRNFTLYT